MAVRRYDLNQSPLYKLGSKARLAELLNLSVRSLIGLSRAPKYRIFLLEASTCPFTYKVTKERWVQEPCGALKRVHERLQNLFMRLVPPLYAHAAVKGRSYRTNALAHVDGKAAATFDIRKFYPSTSQTAVFLFFADTMLCAPDIADLISRLVCLPSQGSNRSQGLPTGSALSPVLSIFANKALFDYLDKLAGQHDLKFTCYVDDLTFSGDSLPLGLPSLVNSAIERYGHTMAKDKSRVFRNQRAKHITGVVIKNGAIAVPNARFHKARRIQSMLVATSDSAEKLDLTQRLAGLLGEAAFLDSKYKPWAKRSYESLALARINAAVAIGTPD